MNKDKSPVQGGGVGTHYAAYGSPPGGFAPMADPSPPSSAAAAAHPGHDNAGGRYSHDISRMPDFPPRNRGHRRAQSEIITLPDDITFDSDLGFVGSHDGPSLSDENDDDLFSMFIDVEKLNFAALEGESSGNVAAPHLPTTTTAAAAAASGAVAAWPSEAESSAAGSRERPRPRHQHSQSMDGSTSIKPELLGSSGEGPSSLVDAKKAMSAAKLADLALVDPKRAKRIWANRQSAARSKERKLRYIAELERKLQALQTEATTLSAQLTLLQRDTSGLTAENNELKLRLQTMEQQVHLQDALNDALRDEVQRLKLATGQMPNGGAAAMMNFAPPHSFGTSQQFYHHNQAMQSILTARQLQQLQIHSQHQQPPPLQHPPPHPHLQDPLTNPRMKGSLPSPSPSPSPSSSLSQRVEGKSDSNSI